MEYRNTLKSKYKKQNGSINMKYKVFRPNGLVYQTNSYIKLICYALFIRRNKSFVGAVLSADERASYEFHIYGNGVEVYDV